MTHHTTVASMVVPSLFAGIIENANFFFFFLVSETWSCYVAHTGLRSSCISLPVTRTTEVNHRLRKSIAVLIEMCYSLLSVAVLQHSEQTELREERVSFSSHCPVTVYHRGKSRQGLEAGTEAETMAKCCLWACSSGLGSD